MCRTILCTSSANRQESSDHYKKEADKSDSYLAQGGICVLTEDSDYDSFYGDTLKAGHMENDTRSVELMIRSSPKCDR